MIEINEKNLKYAYAKLKKYIYYSNSNYIRDRLYSFERALKIRPNLFQKMSDDLNALGNQDNDILKYNFPICTFYPKKDAMKDIDNGIVSIDRINAFIDMDIKFYLIDVLFCLELIDIYKGYNKELFFGNLIHNKLLSMEEDERISNNLLFEKYWPDYQKWKKAISKDLTDDDIKNSTLVKLDFQRCFYNVKFNIVDFLKKYELSFSDPVVKIALSIYRAYSYSICNCTTGKKEKNIVQLPIGLPSSNIIQNILFSEFDERMRDNPNTIRYGRYVDDVLVLVKGNLKKDNFYELYKDVFEYDNAGNLLAKVNTIFLKSMLLNPKKIDIQPGSTIERLNSEIDRILSPSMLDYWNEEQQDDELVPNSNQLDDTLDFKYMKKYIDSFLPSDNNIEELIEYLKHRKSSELLNLYICWDKIIRIIYKSSYYNDFVKRIGDIIEKVSYINEDSFFKDDPNIQLQLRIRLKKELTTAIYLSNDNNYYLFDVNQKDMFDYLSLVDNGENINVFYPASIKFEYVQLYYSYAYEFGVDYLERCKELYRKANGFELNFKNNINDKVIDEILDCDVRLDIDEENRKEYSRVYILKDKYFNDELKSNEEVENESKKKNDIKIAVASINIPFDELKTNDFKGIYSSTYNLRTIKKLISEAANLGAEYIIMPEFCAVFNDALSIINHCSRHHISIVTGLSHCLYKSGYGYNYVLIYDDKSKFVHLKSKNYYPYEERKILGHKGYKPGTNIPYYVVVDNGKIKYSTMTCFEATNIRDRGFLNNKINLLFMPVYNKDTSYFSDIIGSFSRDISTFVAQSNTSEYGDSRITGPMASWFKEVVRLKGGENSFIVVGRIDIDTMYLQHKNFYDIDVLIENMAIESTQSKRDTLNDEVKEKIDAAKEPKSKHGKYKPLSAGSDYNERFKNDLE